MILQHPIPISSQTLSPSLFNFDLENWNPFSTILIMLFFGFLVSSYPVQPHATSHKYWIYKSLCRANPIKSIIMIYTDYKTWHQSKSWVFKSCFYFKIGQHVQQYLNLQYKVLWSLLKMVGLLVQTTTCTISTKNSFFHFSQLLPPYFTPFLVHKTILITSTNTLSLNKSVIFKLPIFRYTAIPTISSKSFFLILTI